MSTNVYLNICMHTHRIRPAPSRLVCTLRLILLSFLLFSTSNMVLYADDSIPVAEPTAAETGPPESATPSDSPEPVATDAAEETLDQADADLIGNDADGALVDGDVVEIDHIAPVDQPVLEVTGVVQAAHVDSSSVRDVESDATTAESSVVEAASHIPNSETEEIAGEQASDPSAAAWKFLNPSYSSQTPLPASGKAMYYNPGVMDKVQENRLKFKRIELCEECIGRVAMLRYGDVNRKVWLQFHGSQLEGPFHVIDTAATQHVGMLLERNWILDVDYQTAQRWGMRMPYVTIWEDPPLELLMANFAIPLNWNASMSPAAAFESLPRSVDSVVLDQLEEYHAIKRNLKLQHRDVDSYRNLLSDLPSELFVK